jgi:hypothetical protein
MGNFKRTMIAAAVSLALAASFTSINADETAGADVSGSDSNSLAGMGAHMSMGPHMTMTELRAPTSADTARGQEIIRTMREKLSEYEDYKVAEAQGYEPFMPTVPQDVYHFANRPRTAAEYAGDFDLARPGSLLYEKKTFGGWKLVGAMYDAPATYTPEQLDKLIPLGLVRWHEHTNICLPPGITEQDIMTGGIHAKRTAASAMCGINNGDEMRYGYMADGRFGFIGTISTEDDCEAAGGSFHKQIFAWMVHVYPFASDDFKVAFSTDAP